MKSLPPRPPAHHAPASRPRVARVLPLLLMLLAWLSVAAGPPQWHSGHNRPIRLTWGQVQAAQTPQQGPAIQARAAVMQDAATGTILWQKEGDAPLPMASVTKLMTVLVALETLSPDDVVTIPAQALNIAPGYVRMGLQTGQKVTVRTLLYGALLPSGNDAALALAVAAAGSEQAFVDKMNAHARAWGLTHTHFVNPHGIDAPGHESSARDLAQLARRALQNPLIAQIVATPSIQVQGFELHNTNQLLGQYPGAYGVKTGTTDDAGQVLIAAARRSGQGDVITVVLHSPDRYAESTALLDAYFSNWTSFDAAPGPNVLNQLIGPDGRRYALSTPQMPLLLPRWQALRLHPLRVIGFDATGHPSGLYQLWLDGSKLQESPIIFTPQP